jgi:hypothetical protein
MDIHSYGAIVCKSLMHPYFTPIINAVSFHGKLFCLSYIKESMLPWRAETVNTDRSQGHPFLSTNSKHLCFLLLPYWRK